MRRFANWLTTKKEKKIIKYSELKNLQNSENDNNYSLNNYSDDQIKIDNGFNEQEIYFSNKEEKSNDDFVIKFKGVNKTYWQFFFCEKCFCCKKKDINVLNNLNLDINNGEKFGLFGNNGSGKSTLIKAITREILLDSGSIIINGLDINKDFSEKKSNSSIGYCPQENPLFDYMKVKEVIQFYIKLKKNKNDYKKISKDYILEEYEDKLCKELSGGNKRKLSLAIALMNNPSILLLDEPTTGVDIESRRIIWDKITALSNNSPKFHMILSTTSKEEVDVSCDKIKKLENGNLQDLQIYENQKYKIHIKFKNSFNDNNNNLIIDNDNANIDNNIINIDNKKDIINIDNKKDNIKNELSNNFINSIKNYLTKIESKSCEDLSFDYSIEIKEEQKDAFFKRIIDIKYINKMKEINNINEVSELLIMIDESFI